MQERNYHDFGTIQRIDIDTQLVFTTISKRSTTTLNYAVMFWKNTMLILERESNFGGYDMKLLFKGGKTSSCLSLDTDKKTYIKFNGTGSNMLVLDTQKALNDLELTLIKNGYVEER